MRIACIQYSPAFENPEENFKIVRDLVKKAKDKGAEIICLPELFSTGVTLNSEKFSEKIGEKTCEFLSKQAKDNKVYILGSFIEKDDRIMPKNTSVIYDGTGSFVCKYNKNHVFTFGNEDKAYSKGDDITFFKIGNFNFCPFICYDLRFPEIFRIASKKGVDVFIISANWPIPREDHWLTLLKARAIENQAYVIGVNICGKVSNLNFFGSSVIISPKGEIIAKASDKEEILIGEIDKKSIDEWRKAFPALKDRKDNYNRGI